MEPDRFDAVIRSLAPANRRQFARWLAAGGLAAFVGRNGRVAAAHGSHPGCRKSRRTCTRGDQCCSGVCLHKKCRTAPNQGTCTIRENVCTQGYPAAACNGDGGCQCFLTTSGASFCGGGGIATACSTDADCLEIGLPAGTRCVNSQGGMCAGATECIQPCPYPTA